MANQAKLLKNYQQSVGDAEREEEELRRTLDKIYTIRNLRNEMRMAARANGNKENIRRAAHMKMLANSAQTIPLWVGKMGKSHQSCAARYLPMAAMWPMWGTWSPPW